MVNEAVVKDYLMRPGFACVPYEPTRIATVVSSGVAVTMYDKKRNFGGMAHFFRPYRENGLSNSKFAAPSIVSLYQMISKRGSTPYDLEAYLYGGAENYKSNRFNESISRNNITVGIEILDKLKIPIIGKDVGGNRGRKIVFHTGTGEVVVAKVDRIRESDWYMEV